MEVPETKESYGFFLTEDNQGNVSPLGFNLLYFLGNSGGRAYQKQFQNEQIQEVDQGLACIALSNRDLEKYDSKSYPFAVPLKKEQVLDHPGWRILLRHPDAVPKEFAYNLEQIKEVIDRSFAQMDQRGYTSGMVFSSFPESTATSIYPLGISQIENKPLGIWGETSKKYQINPDRTIIAKKI